MGGAVHGLVVDALVLSAGAVAADNSAGGHGGFFHASRARSLIIVNATASGNKAGGSGGVLSVAAAPSLVSFTAATLNSNTARRGSGGVFNMLVPQPVTLLDSHFTSNYAGGSGGALSVSSPLTGALFCNVSIANTSFTGNSAGSDKYPLSSSIANGGAISVVSSPKFRASAVVAGMNASTQASGQGTELTEPGANTILPAGSSNAAVSLDSACALMLERVAFERNKCSGSGGALAATTCPVLMLECTFTGNTARVSGGGVASILELTELAAAGIEDKGADARRLRMRLLASAGRANPIFLDEAWWLDIRSSVFDSNLALLNCGGGLYTDIAMGIGSSVTGSTFRANTANGLHGGGVCIISRSGGAEAVLSEGTELTANTASGRGGGLYADLSSGGQNAVTLHRVALSRHEAEEGGGAFLLAAPTSKLELRNWDALGASGSDTECWPLLLLDVSLPSKELEAPGPAASGLLHVRPGTPFQASIRLYNGLGEPVQQDLLTFMVDVSLEPAALPVEGNAAGLLMGNSSDSAPQRPWQDPSLAFLDPGVPGGSLTARVVGGRAAWPYLTVRGWPGRYWLVFRVAGTEDDGLFQVWRCL
ncbi:hypothetical protein GPECTOR_53g146 [Gonium pectorale]|uniref:Right handed beta helix domain-containing protein n=1 Tax=Gonium pectorale TaxID=33097 RepID=A0A150G872_GONPE|nr:hypothetical protein GPECTOR_53g146 [Gonium pectorale]|eukprot:KXZ45560.1 hypothetical protein GPECTOR_53g146 [Gonium pectorale]